MFRVRTEQARRELLLTRRRIRSPFSQPLTVGVGRTPGPKAPGPTLSVRGWENGSLPSSDPEVEKDEALRRDLATFGSNAAIAKWFVVVLGEPELPQEDGELPGDGNYCFALGSASTTLHE